MSCHGALLGRKRWNDEGKSRHRGVVPRGGDPAGSSRSSASDPAGVRHQSEAAAPLTCECCQLRLGFAAHDTSQRGMNTVDVYIEVEKAYTEYFLWSCWPEPREPHARHCCLSLASIIVQELASYLHFFFFLLRYLVCVMSWVFVENDSYLF